MSEKKCFIITKYSAQFDGVNKAIMEAVDQAGLRCQHFQYDRKPKDITFSIVRAIIEADLIIANITEPNPNVYYELGISHSVGNKTIIICRDGTKPPFDLHSQFHLKYKDSKEGLEVFSIRLSQTIPLVLESPEEPSNLVQIGGRSFFDQKRRVEKALGRLSSELDRITAFQKYIRLQRKIDNSAVIRKLANIVLQKQATASNPFLVAISGAAGLGKTTLGHQLRAALIATKKHLRVGILPTDAFMYERQKRLRENLSGYDPKAHKLDKLVQTICNASEGKTVRFHAYNHKDGKHEKRASNIGPSDVLIVEGIHSFYPDTFVKFPLKIFLYAAPPDAKELRFITDLFDRKYPAHLAFEHAETELKEFEQHVLHYMQMATQVVRVTNFWEYKFTDS